MLQSKLLAVMSAVNGEVAERKTLVSCIAIALLTRKNLFILGDTGAAKSYAINQFRSRITGAKQFERLLSKQCDEEQLFGRLDLGSLIPGGVPQAVLKDDHHYQSILQIVEALKDSFQDVPSDTTMRTLSAEIEMLLNYRQALSVIHQSEPSIITDGKIPDSHIIFLDEIFKANDGVLNSLLTALNERHYTNEGCTVDIPALRCASFWCQTKMTSAVPTAGASRGAWSATPPHEPLPDNQLPQSKVKTGNVFSRRSPIGGVR